MNEEKNIRKNITSTFKMNGLIVKGNASSFLCQQLLPVPENQRNAWISKIIDCLQRKQTIYEPIIELEHMTDALRDCYKAEINDIEDAIIVISAPDVPRFRYNINDKNFNKCDDDNLNDDPCRMSNWADSKSAMFRNRYVILKQKLERHELLASYKSGLLASENTTTTTALAKLCAVDSLLSSSTAVDALVLGLLTRLKVNRFFIEDPTGILPLNLKTAKAYHGGLFTENCFILAEGRYVRGVFRVNGLGFPPPESSEISRTYYSNANTFGGPSEISLKCNDRMRKLESEHSEAMIVFVADVFLDRKQVMRKLKILFAGFDRNTPVAIVMMGNFLSETRSDEGETYPALLTSKFNELADLINEYENLAKETLFVIVPGPGDSLAANILPRPALPTAITASFSLKVPKSVITTNPCRIQYCTQEIVILREDLVHKMFRHRLRFPIAGTTDTNDSSTTTSSSLSENFARTILCQSFLINLPLSVCPVYCTADNILSLYPPPDLIIVADGMRDAFVEKYKETIVANPGSFSKRKFIFKVYEPAKNLIEDSQISEDT